MIRVTALVRVAALIGVPTPIAAAVAAARRGIAALILGRVAALIRWVLAAAGIILRVSVTVVVVIVAGPPLSLAAAVIRVIGHRWFS